MLKNILSSKGMIWGAVSVLYLSLLLYTGYYTFLSNNEFATDERKLKIVLGNIGYNDAEKANIVNHLETLLAPGKRSEIDDAVRQLKSNLMEILGQHKEPELIPTIQQLFSAPEHSLFEESQIDAIIGLYLNYQKERDLAQEDLKGKLWFTDVDGETQVHLNDLKINYAHELVKREAESFNNVNNLATQSFTIVLGALLGFLSASLSDTQETDKKEVA